MKMLRLVFLVSISVSYVTSKATIVTIDPERLPVIFNTFTVCIDKTGVDSETMQKIIEWNFEDNDLVKKFMYCFAKNSGYGDNNGYLVKETISQLVGNHKIRYDFVNAVDECNKLRGNNKYDTIFKTVSCFRNKSPVLFKL